MKRCEQCRFYYAMCKKYPTAGDKLAKLGECRKNAPVALSQLTAQGIANYGGWPTVLHSDGCGDWEAKA